jgi:zinc transporter
LWLHFDLSVPGATQSLDTISGVPEPAKEFLKATIEHQQLFIDDACTYGVFANLIENPDEVAGDIDFVQFAITERLFISSSRSQLAALEFLRDIVRNKVVTGPVELLRIILEYVVAFVGQHAEGLANTPDDIEEKMLSDNWSDQKQAIGQIRRTAVRLHRQISIARSLNHRVAHDDVINAKLSLRSVAEGLSPRLDWLNTEIDALRERAHLLQEEAMLKAADQTNSQLQVLAIVATVFLPATLVAGIFGMNVKGLPLTDNINGFFWSMTILIVASALIFWLLRRSGILGK